MSNTRSLAHGQLGGTLPFALFVLMINDNAQPLCYKIGNQKWNMA